MGKAVAVGRSMAVGKAVLVAIGVGDGESVGLEVRVGTGVAAEEQAVRIVLMTIRVIVKIRVVFGIT